jgi:hypothetical protein
MRHLFLTIPDPPLAARMVQELKALGVDEQGIRLFAERPQRLSGAMAKVPVPVAALRVPPGRIALRALGGALLVLALALLLMSLGGAAALSLAALVGLALLGAIIGATTVLRGGPPREVRALRPELRADDVVMVAEVPDDRLAEIEQALNERHPELKVKGTDPGGSPPFP